MPESSDIPATGIERRLERVDWSRVERDLDNEGFARLPGLLNRDQCRRLARCYGEPERFRSRIVMARHAFGSGEYRYFDYPLPEAVDVLRRQTYPQLAPIANCWNEVLGVDTRYPARLDEYLKRCHKAGQRRATPLILTYGAGDYNRLHQDVYGELLFPMQLAVLLSEPGEDFEGGEFMLVEQRPRTQLRGMVVPLTRGDAVIFPVRHRPGRGKRGYHRLTMRHGVSQVRSGSRYTLGVIFHDAA